MTRLAILPLVILLLTGCGGAGATSPAAGSPTREASMASSTFELSSTQFAAGGVLPVDLTCDGEDRSPDLAWSGAPDGTGALVLLVDDPDASGFVHWIVYDMTATDSGALPLGVSTSPDAPPQGTNDFGNVGWGGPCPPSGEHRYRFTLTALGAPLGLSGAPKAAALRDALRSASVLGSAVLEGRYRRR